MLFKKPFLMILCFSLFGTSFLYGQIPLERDATLPMGPISLMEETIPTEIFISTRTGHTLHDMNNYFYVYDRDMTLLKPMGQAEAIFKGLPFNILSLDAVDFIFSTPPPDGPFPPPMVLLFSVRESQSITQKDGTTFYAKQEDLVILNPNGMCEVAFPGICFNCPGVDGASYILDFNNDFEVKLLISPTEDWYVTEGDPDLHIGEEDIACYSPDKHEVTLFMRGADLGIHTLDAFDYVQAPIDAPPGEDMLFFSVRCPEYLDQPGTPLYLYDQDVAMVRLVTEAAPLVNQVIYGNEYYLHDLDALAVGNHPGRAFMAWGHHREGASGASGSGPTIK